MEDVRPILVNQHAGIVVMVVGIAADVHALVDDEDLAAGVSGEPFRHDRPGKAGSDNEVVEHRAPILCDERMDRTGCGCAVRARRSNAITDVPGHARPGGVPRHAGQRRVGAADPFAGALAQCCANGLDERLGRISDARQTLIAVRMHDVGDRRRHHRAAGSEILGCLRRTDVSRRLVACKRQHRHVPVGDVVWQLCVGLRAEVVNVRGRRQRLWIDLHDRTDQDEVPSWRRGRGAGDQVPIQALIENAEEPDARRRDRRLIARDRGRGCRAAPKCWTSTPLGNS